MEENKSSKSGKLSYEKLEEVAMQLSQQVKTLQQQVQQMDYGNFHQRMLYLFKVIENKEAFDLDFINKCVKEIQDVMTPPKEIVDINPELTPPNE